MAVLALLSTAGQASAVQVLTKDVTQITYNTATATGSITDPWRVTAYGFCWNTEGSPTIGDNSDDQGGTRDDIEYSAEISELDPGTTYYIRAYAREWYGAYYYGNVVTFTTRNPLPIVTTQAVTDIEDKSATGHGTIVELGRTNPTQHGVCWNKSGNPTTKDRRTKEGPVSQTGEFESEIDDLKSDTTYYVRAYATNSHGTAYGDEVTFTTGATLPRVSTQSPTEIGNNQVTAHGTIEDLGAPDPQQHGFCWNTSGMPGLDDFKIDLGAADDTGSFSADIQGLSPNTTYYIRAYATNDAGTVYGEPEAFTTEAVPPRVLTDTITQVGTHSAVGNGAITDLGDPAAHQHGFCWNTAGDPSVSDHKSEEGPVREIGSFSTLMDNLVPDTTYYARAYAISESGTYYGEIASFGTATGASAPVATLGNLPAKTTSAASYSIQVGGIGVVGYKYRIDEGHWSTERLVDDPITFEVFDEGHVSLAVVGKNDAHMWQSEDNPTMVGWYIDTTPPRAVLFNYPAGTSDTSGIDVHVGGRDVVSYRYRIDGDAWSGTRPVGALIRLENLPEGEHLLEVVGADYANNWQDETQATQAAWTHDTTIPTAVLDNTPQTMSNQTTATVSVGYPQNGIPVTEYTYTVDDGHTWWQQPVDEPISLSGLNAGEHTLCVNAYGSGSWQDGQDGMSSIENATCVQWRVDLTPADPALLAVDSTAAVATVSGGMPGTASAVLSWEWSSPDPLETVQRYRIWISENEIEEASLDEATEIFCDLSPGIQGVQEVYQVDGLLPGRQYHFAVKSIDGAGNLSELSNVAALLPDDQLPTVNSIGLAEGGLAADNATRRELEIDGLNFMATSGCNRVRFESSSWVFDTAAKGGSTSLIRVDIPAGAPPGAYRIRVINKNGISAASSEVLTITEAAEPVPVVTEIDPVVAEIGIPAVVTIIGENFDAAGVSANLLSRDGRATPLSSIMVHDSETITAIVDVPEAFAEGRYDIQVINVDGSSNQVSAVKLELCNPIELQSDTSSLVTTKSIDLGIGAIPAQTTLTTDDRSEVGVIDTNHAKIKVFLDSGSAFEIDGAGQTGWADFRGTLRPPRQRTTRTLHQGRLDPNSVYFAVGTEDSLRLKNGGTFFVLIEVPLPAADNDPAVYYLSPGGDLALAGLDGAWRGIALKQGGTVLAERPDTPETGMTTYTVGLLSNAMSDYAIGSLPAEDPAVPPNYGGDDYGACYVSSLNTANMVVMHGVIVVSVLVLVVHYYKRRKR